MKKIIALAVLMVAVPQAFHAQWTSTIEGDVLDAKTDLPLEGVMVSLLPDTRLPVGMTILSSEIKTGFTDSQGHFAIPEVMPGRYRAAPERSGFVFAPRQGMKLARDPGVWVQVSSGQPVSGIQLNMVKEGVITGRVLDSNGHPAPGSTAALMRYTFDEYGNRTLSWIPGIKYPGAAGSFVRMNDLGEYRFYGLPAGDYYVQVSGGPRGGSPPKLPVGSFYPGTVDESKAVQVHVESGEEIQLGTMTFQQVDSIQVRFQFVDVGDPPISRSIFVGDGMVVTTSPQPVTLPMRPGHYDGLVTTPTSFGNLSFDVGSTDIEQTVVMKSGPHVKVRLALEDGNGKRSAYAPGIAAFGCSLRSETTHSISLCSGVLQDGGYYVGSGGAFLNRLAAIPPDSYQLEFPRLPEDSYVLAATVSGHDIRRGPIQVDHDIEIEAILSASGAVIRGSVRDSQDERLPDAVVVLVPDEPLRGIGDLYRTCISDTKGNFELRGIAPGNYRLFAWPELEGVAYRNAQFMKKFEDGGKPVQVEKGRSLSVDLKTVDESKTSQN